MFGWFGGLLLKAASAFRLALPEPLAVRFMGGLGRLAASLPLARRRVALRNLRRFFPDRSDPELRVQLRDTLELMALSYSDMMLLFRQDRDRFCRMFRAEGLEHLTSALSSGRGAILVSGHYGAFPMLAAALPSLGIPFHLLYRPPRAGPVRTLFADWLARTGATIIEDQPRHLAALRCLEALGKGACVCLLTDQHFPAGVVVPFGGWPAKTGVGAALLAARSGAPLVPVRLFHSGPATYRMIVEPALPGPASRDREELTRVTAAIALTVERWIREDPAPWFWFHRRWKDVDREEDLSRT